MLMFMVVMALLQRSPGLSAGDSCSAGTAVRPNNLQLQRSPGLSAGDRAAGLAVGPTLGWASTEPRPFSRG